MPLYHFKCGCGVIELLVPMVASDAAGYDCSTCGQFAERQVELCSMRPDPYWSGVMTKHDGYVTSASKLAQSRKDRHLVEVGDRADREAMKKRADEAAKDREDKFAADTRAFFDEHFSGQGLLDSFGNLRPEANRKLSDEEILNPEAQKQKKESINITSTNE